MRRYFRITFFIILIIYTTTLINAQLIRGFGLKGGITSVGQKLDYQYWEAGIDNKRKIGINLALFLEWLNANPLSFLTQVEYDQGGFGSEIGLTSPQGPEIIGTKTYYNRLDYLTIPVFAKITIRSESLSPYIFAGPKFNYLIGSKSDDDVFKELNDKYKKALMSGSLGIGLEVKLGATNSLLIEARYSTDLTDAYNTEFLKIKGDAIDLWIGVLF